MRGAGKDWLVARNVQPGRYDDEGGGEGCIAPGRYTEEQQTAGEARSMGDRVTRNHEIRNTPTVNYCHN